MKKRKSNRLQNYDCSSEGAYFITLVTANRQNLFGEIVDEEMILNALGEIVHEEWIKTGDMRPHVRLDEFIIMPNHFHAILFLMNDNRRGGLHPPEHTLSQNRAHRSAPLRRKPKSLGSLVAGFKSAATTRINHHRNTPAQPVWQRNYHDRIIRNERELNATRQYILDNPLQWAQDTENSANIK